MKRKPLQLLLVEDNRLDAERVKDLLEERAAFPFELTHVDRLAPVKKLLSKRRFDLVLLDLFLPDSHGPESLGPLQALAIDVPILVLTALSDETAGMEALKKGAQDYLVKNRIDGDLLGRAIMYAIERKKLEREVRRLVNFDLLTDLPNRTLFKDRLERGVAHARRYDRCLGLLTLDLDSLHSINESFGHEVGDQLLIEVAKRITGVIRKSDSAARLGGDEFAILIPEMKRPEDASMVADRLLVNLRAPFVLDGHELYISASIGACVFPNDGEEAEILLKNAESTMNFVKQQEKDAFRMYSPAINARAARRLNMNNALRRALENEEFVLHFDPQYNLEDGYLAGAEALIRWQHADHGLTLDGAFLPTAEDSGLIVRIGEWVLYSACAQAKQWHQAGHPSMRISVNISPRQFNHKDLFGIINRTLKTTGFEAKDLVLEISENGIVEAGEAALITMKKLHEIGVRLMIDDFATGLFSLRRLKSFPIHGLKINRCFLRSVPANREDLTILKSITSMAAGMKLELVAEGVESLEQINLLKELGCRFGQGPYFNLPTGPESLLKMLIDRDFLADGSISPDTALNSRDQ